MLAIRALGRLAAVSGGLARLGCTAAAGAAAAAPAAAPAAAAAALSWRHRYSSEAADAWESMRAGFSSIEAEVEGGVATITVARPEALNALNKQVRLVIRQLLALSLCGMASACRHASDAISDGR